MENTMNNLQPFTTRRPIMENAPALELDKVLYKNRPMSPRTRRERRIVWNLFKHLATAGWYPSQVWDSEKYTKTNTPKAAMELIFNLDEAHVFVSKKGQKPHSIFLVLGNDLDVLSDWTYGEADTDGFNALIDKFDAEVYA
jgi:hypothetical protein